MTSTTSWENCGRAAERLPYLLERRRALGVLGLGGAMVIAGRGQAASNNQAPKSLRYLAYVDGSRSGIQDIDFVPRERGFTVMSSLCFRLEVAFVTIYRYQQTGQEDWKDGKLLGFEYITNNDGATSHVTAQRDGSDNFSVIGQNGQRTAPGDAMAASFWNGAVLDRPHIIDASNRRACNSLGAIARAKIRDDRTKNRSRKRVYISDFHRRRPLV